MADVRAHEDLWRSCMAPEGRLERWRAAPGQEVAAGQAVAEVRIEDALHEILAPAGGRFVPEDPNLDLIEPGALIGRIE